jgi:hypothetical protein
MKKISVLPRTGCINFFLLILTIFSGHSLLAQSCTTGTSSISNFPNTYYPSSANAAAGATSISLGGVTNGTDAIQFGDVLLVIQMQGAGYSSSNDNTYGDGTGTGSGYSTASLLAGQMEYIVAANNVPLTGGTLNLRTPLVNSYYNLYSGTYGQHFSYQVIRVPVYYNLKLTGSITAPAWDGNQGGVLVLYATNNIDLNNQTVDASGKGFRGGGGRQLSGGGGSSGDYRRPASSNFDASKGEGLAGTPMYTLNNGALLTGSYDGYNGGSFAQGAPGNAGGGGTDGNPGSNDQNTGGGGGGNGGTGGKGGNAWSSGTTAGGVGGAIFAQASPTHLVMGGGGGAGTTNNGTGTPGNGLASSGAAGGGMIIVWAQNQINGTGSILANGADANSTVQNDGAGGGGAGGSILIFSKVAGTNSITAQAIGGNGGSNETGGGDKHGPGGGGGGGAVFVNTPLTAPSAIAGGLSGQTSANTTNYGAANGVRGFYGTLTAASMPLFPVPCQTLAVSFLDVTAKSQNNGSIDLRWDVALEVNTAGYDVEKSTDGAHFTTIATVAYKAGDATGNSYQYNDATASAGKVFYRIRETDADGSGIYSKTVTVQLGYLTGTLSVFPNPAQNNATVSFNLSSGTAISLRLFDLNGRELWSRQLEGNAGLNTVSIDVIRTLPDGMYILQWFDKLQPQQAKIVVRH